MAGTSVNRSRTLSPRHPAVTAAAVLACEQLESRVLLTSMLYLDYGDRWAGGVLNTTVGAIDSTAAAGNPNIDGPRLSDANGDSYGDDITVAISSLATINPGSAAAIRATMTALTSRFFEPFDITVVDLTANFQNVNGISVRAPANLTEA